MASTNAAFVIVPGTDSGIQLPDPQSGINDFHSYPSRECPTRMRIGLGTIRPAADVGLTRARSSMIFTGSPRLLHIVSTPSPSSRGVTAYRDAA